MAGAVAVAALCAADVVVAPWTAPARAATTDDFDRFRLQWLATMVRHYDPADAVLVKYAQDTAAVASEFWRGATPLNTSDARTYLWQDLHDPTVSRQSALMTSTTVRLRQLALGLKTPVSSLASDPQLKSDLLSAIDWFLANSYHTVNRAGNLVGLADRHPKALNDFCVLMYDELSTEQIDTAMAASLWLNAGVPPTQVAEWAGHSVNVLLRVYAKCIVGQDEVARQRVQAALRPETPR